MSIFWSKTTNNKWRSVRLYSMFRFRFGTSRRTRELLDYFFSSSDGKRIVRYDCLLYKNEFVIRKKGFCRTPVISRNFARLAVLWGLYFDCFYVFLHKIPLITRSSTLLNFIRYEGHWIWLSHLSIALLNNIRQCKG